MYEKEFENIRKNLNTMKEIAIQLAKNNERIMELCQLLIDGMMLDEPNEALIYFRETMGMTDEELKQFGINA